MTLTPVDAPIYEATLADWQTERNTDRLPGQVPADLEIVEQVDTPLIRDVIIHGSAPWDEERRQRMAQHLPKKKPVARARKRTSPRPQRKAAAR